MERDKNTKRATHEDIEALAPDVWHQPIQPSLTPPFGLTAKHQRENARLPARRMHFGQQRLQSVVSAIELGLLVSIIWLKKAAQLVESVIHGYLNSTTLTQEKRNTTLPPSYPEGMLGLVKSYDGKSENAEYFARTATGNIPLSSKTTTPTLTCEPLSEKSMPITISPNDFSRIRDALIAGEADLSNITFEQYLQVSFLSLFDGLEIHNELKVIYKGNVFTLHACVNGVVPSQSVEALRKQQ